MLIIFKTAILYVSYIVTNFFSLFHDAVNSSDFTKSVGKMMVKESNDLDRYERRGCGVVGCNIQNVSDVNEKTIKNFVKVCLCPAEGI